MSLLLLREQFSKIFGGLLSLGLSTTRGSKETCVLLTLAGAVKWGEEERRREGSEVHVQFE